MRTHRTPVKTIEHGRYAYVYFLFSLFRRNASATTTIIYRQCLLTFMNHPCASACPSSVRLQATNEKLGFRMMKEVVTAKDTSVSGEFIRQQEKRQKR